MEKLTYKNVLEELIKYVPELKSYDLYMGLKSSNDLPYVVFGTLENFFKQLFADNNSKTLIKISKFLERASSSEDDKLLELVMFGFMETFYGNDPFDKNMLDYLGPNSKKVLFETLEHNAKIGMDDKDEILKLFGDKLK